MLIVKKICKMISELALLDEGNLSMRRNMFVGRDLLMDKNKYKKCFMFLHVIKIYKHQD